MVTDEAARHHLYEHARTTWDDDAARTLMSALPWDVTELASKQDLRELEHKLDAKLERGFRLQFVALAALNASLVGVVAAVVQLLA